MEQDHEAQRIREAIAGFRLKRGRRNEPYPEEIRAMVVSYVRRRRQDGHAPARIGEQVGVHPVTLRTWLARATQEEEGALPGFASIRVRTEETKTQSTAVPAAVSSCALVLVTPGGFRLEGLSVDQAARLLARLS